MTAGSLDDDSEMTRNTNNSHPTGSGDRPGEDVMLAWIEGELPASEVRRLESQYPKAAFNVRLMRGDAAALRACAGEAAPADLAARTIEALQRETMLRLVAAEAETPGEPVRMTLEREPVVARIGGWRVALAAMLTLTVGTGVYFATTRHPPPASEMSNLAKNTSSAEEKIKVAIAAPVEPSAAEAPSGDEPQTQRESGALAMKSEGAAPVADAVIADAAPIVESSLAATDRLLAMAREGRLVMRVEGATRPLSVVEATAARDKSKSWRLSKDVPDAVLASLVPVVVPSETSERGEPSPVVVAADRVPESALPIGPGAMRSALPIPVALSAPRATAYYAELTADGDTLDHVRTMFATSLKAGVEFDVLDTPLAIDSPAGVDDVLWWSQSPANWSPRVTVPVVVKRR